MAIKFLSGLNLSNVTAGSILKLDSNGNIVAAVDGTDYNTAAGSWTTTGSDIYRNSDVRIGTYQSGVAPAARLHVFDYQTTDPKLLIEDGNTGDASMQFKISTQQYTMGIDNSDSDKFIIANAGGFNLAANTHALEIATNGKITVPAHTSNGAIRLEMGGYNRLRFNGGIDLLGYSSEHLWVIGNSTTNTINLGADWDWDKQVAISYTPGTVGGAGGQMILGQTEKNNTNWTHGITAFHTNGAERMRINSSGNVGIGTASPATDLSVGSVSHTSPDDTNRILNWYASTGGAEVSNSSHYITVGQNSSNTSQPKSVGLALFNPNTANNTYSPAITFGGLSTSGDYMTGAGAISTQLIANADDNNFRGGDLTFYTSGITQATRGLNEKMRITAGGNVGIGTTSPSQKLHVAGDIYTTSDFRGNSIISASAALTISNTGIQPDQGDVEDIVAFNFATTKVAHIDTDGYIHAAGFKTNTAATGFLKANGTVDTGSFFSGAYNDLSGKPTLGTMASAATSDYKTSDATETYVATELASYTLTSALGTAATTASSDYATSAQGTTADNALPKAGGTMTGALVGTTATFIANAAAGTNALNILGAANGNGTGITFSDNGTPAASASGQNGYITYYHGDGSSYGSGNTLIMSSSETTMTILADGKLMYKEGIYSKPASGTGAGTRKDANWDTSYTYSQVGHLPLAGGTMSGGLTGTTATFSGQAHFKDSGNSSGGSILMGPSGSGVNKWSYLAGTHYNQDTGSGNGSGSAGVAVIGCLSTSTYNKVLIGGNPYEINPATQIEFWTHTSTTHTLGGSVKMKIAGDGAITFSTYGAGILKTNASGVVSLDTNTYSTATGVEDNADVTDATNVAAAGALMKAGGTMSGTLALDNADSLSFESGKHWITYNDGEGNFNIRVGHKSDSSTNEVSTETGYVFHDEWSQSSGWREFNVSGTSITEGNDVGTWRRQIFYDYNDVRLSYQGGLRLQTTSAGVTVSGNIAATNFSGSSSGTNTGDQDLSGYSTASGVADNADVTPSWIPANDPSYLTSVPSEYLTQTEGDARYPRGRTISYTSVDTDSDDDAWYKIFRTTDSGSTPVECHVRGYAHSSISFIVSEGYLGGSAHVQVLDYCLSTNNNYKWIKGVRIISNGDVELLLQGGSTVSLEMTIIGDATPVSQPELSSAANNTVKDTVVNPTTGMLRTYGNITGANLSGTNTGDQTLPTLSSLGAAPLDSPALTGTPTAPTAGATVNTTQLATTAFVQTAVSNLVDSSPDALNTLNELAAALGNDASFSTTVTNSIATKLPLAGGTMTGALTITHTGDGLTLQSATDGTTSAGITFTSQGTSASQKGHVRYNHRDGLSYGSAESFTIGGTEATTTILADGKLMYAEGIYSKPSSGTGGGTRRDANWNTAYTYSQVGHLPLAGGTVTGDVVIAQSNTSNHWALKISTNGSNNSGFWTTNEDVRLLLRDNSGNIRVDLYPDSTSRFYDSVQFDSTITHNGVDLTSGTSVDQITEFPMTFQLEGNTWTDTGIDGTDLSTGTYTMQVYVSDFSVGGQHYYEYYSATISWYSGSTNSTVVDEIPVHRAGHAPNAGDLQFRTQRASGTDSHDLMLQVKTNSAYTGALDNSSSGKIMRFKFRRLM